MMKIYVNGQLVERHVGEHYHSLTQTLTSYELQARSRERRFRVFTEQRIRVSDEPRYRVPDLCVKALPYTVTSVLDRPDLAVEIVSPDDETGDTFAKIAEYVSSGIPYIWIIDPYKRSLTEVVHGVIRRPATFVLETPLVGAIDFADIFDRVYEPTE